MIHKIKRIEMEKLYDQYSPLLQSQLSRFVKSLQEKLSIVPVNITYKVRLKSFESFYNKAVNRVNDLKNSLFVIKDLLAVRLICPFNEDVEMLEDYLEKLYNVVEIEKKGLDFSFREFGYNSTHLEVELPTEYWMGYFETPLYCEIQVRTILQDAWAEVEHELVYKNKFAPHDEQLRHKMAALNANLTLSDIIFQEIRSYQKQLRSQLDMRQGRMQQQIDDLLANDYINHSLPQTTTEGLVRQSIDALLLEALRAHNSGQYEKTIDIYSRLLREKLADRVKGVILSHRGMARFSCERYAEALKDFLEANERAESYRICYYLGISYLIIKKFEKAVIFFTRSLSLEGDQPQAFLGRARACFKMGMYEQSLADCEAALTISPDLIAALNFKTLLKESIKKSH